MSAGTKVFGSVYQIYDMLPQPLVLPVFLLTPVLFGLAGAFAYSRIKHRSMTAPRYAISALTGLAGALAAAEGYAIIVGPNPPDPGGAFDTALFVMSPVGGVVAGAATAALLTK